MIATFEQKKIIVTVLIEAGKMQSLLDEFEKRFISEETERFKKWGKRFSIRGKQMNQYKSIAEKLGIDIVK